MSQKKVPLTQVFAALLFWQALNPRLFFQLIHKFVWALPRPTEIGCAAFLFTTQQSTSLTSETNPLILYRRVVALQNLEGLRGLSFSSIYSTSLSFFLKSFSFQFLYSLSVNRSHYMCDDVVKR